MNKVDKGIVIMFKALDVISLVNLYNADIYLCLIIYCVESWDNALKRLFGPIEYLEEKKIIRLITFSNYLVLYIILNKIKSVS